jgi:hypothetical protein
METHVQITRVLYVLQSKKGQITKQDNLDASSGDTTVTYKKNG